MQTLAEVDFPIAAVSKHATREKSIRHGHPSTLHLWWARGLFDVEDLPVVPVSVRVDLEGDPLAGLLLPDNPTLTLECHAAQDALHGQHVRRPVQAHPPLGGSVRGCVYVRRFGALKVCDGILRGERDGECAGETDSRHQRVVPARIQNRQPPRRAQPRAPHAVGERALGKDDIGVGSRGLGFARSMVFPHGRLRAVTSSGWTKLPSPAEASDDEDWVATSREAATTTRSLSIVVDDTLVLVIFV